jgi:hypothetical protein
MGKYIMANGPRMVTMRSSLTGRQTCGGPKKSGLSPTVGAPLSSNPTMLRATNTQHGLTCFSFYIPTSRYHGRLLS